MEGAAGEGAEAGRADGAVQTDVAELPALRELQAALPPLVREAAAIRAEHGAHKTVVLNEFRVEMQRYADALRRDFQQRLGRAEAGGELGRDRTRRASKTALQDAVVVASASATKSEGERHLTLQQELSAAVERLTQENSDLRRQNLVHESTIAAAQAGSDKLMQLLRRNSIAFDLSSVKARHFVDVPVLQDNLQRLEEEKAEAVACRDRDQARISMLEFQVKELRARHTKEMAGAQQARAELEAAKAELTKKVDRLEHRLLNGSDGPDAEYQRDFMRKARAQLDKEQAEALERAMAREKRLALEHAEAQEAAQREGQSEHGRAIVRMQRQHEQILQKRESEHTAEMARLNEVWGKKLGAAEEALARMGAQDTLATVSERQLKIMALASEMYTTGNSNSGDRRPFLPQLAKK